MDEKEEEEEEKEEEDLLPFIMWIAELQILHTREQSKIKTLVGKSFLFGGFASLLLQLYTESTPKKHLYFNSRFKGT
jgi:hypothetical protein